MATNKDKVVKRNDRGESFQGAEVRMGIQPKEEFTEAEKQALSDGTFYEEVAYPGGYSVTRMSSGTHGKNQRHPFIYSKMVAPDGTVLYQQDQYRNYPLINKSPKLVDINDVSFNLGSGETWFNKYKSALDGKNLNSPRTKTSRENDLLEYQQGGSIASRLWNKWTGKDKYVDGYGTTRSNVPVRESVHRTTVKAANSPLVQAIPVVGDIADGYVAADYASRGDYRPAMAAIGAGLVLPNVMEVGARMVPSSTYRNIANKVGDSIEILDVEDNLGRKYVQKNGEWVPKNTDEIEVLGVEKPSRWNRTSDKRFNTMRDNDPTWVPEEVNATEGYDAVFDYDVNSQSNEPWWGWDPIEYQEGGEIPSNDQQQQLFVAIITDMAKTLGVEPSQELAEAVMTAFENNDDSQGLLTLFTKTKNKFMNETGLFREGGKMIAFVEKFKCGGKSPKKKTSKKQEGGEVEGEGMGYLTTPVNDRQMRRNWREATGSTRREARQAQRDLTDYIENQGGISHRGARNSAAAMMGDSQRFALPQESSIIGDVSTPTLNVPAPQLGTPASLEHNYDNFNFNKAFGRARRNGEDTFMWRGKEYTTELAPEPAAQTQIEPRVGTPTAPGNGQYYDPSLDPMFKFGEWLAGGEKGRARRAARRAQNAENMRILSETGVPRHVEPISRFKDYR